MAENTAAPQAIQVRGARVHNLKNIDVDIPLNRVVGIAGVSGSGKSSLALGVLYAEGSRRYLESLSTYTRRRMTQAAKAEVDELLYVPASLALHQRPGVPGIRSTFGTGTELLNSLRLMFSRLAEHRCPKGHYVAPSLGVAAGQSLTCPVCGEEFYAPSAEELAFNSQGACPTCGGTGIVRTVDLATLVPDESLSIDQGAVAPWKTLMWSLMTDVCRAMGVRTHVPFRELTAEEKDIVYHGPAEKKHIFYKAKNSNDAAELDFTYYNAVYTVENALSKVKDEKGMKRVEKFLKEDLCPDCGGTRLSPAARAPKLRGIGLDEACRMTLSQLARWVQGVPAFLPEEMRPMAESICQSFQLAARRLMELGLGYLTLDRAAATLSTGERQRMQLARAVRNRTTGGALRAGRALHRPAPPEHHRPYPGDGGPGGRRQLGAAGGPRHPDSERGGLAHRDGAPGRGPGRAGHRPGDHGSGGCRPSLPDRALPLRESPGTGTHPCPKGGAVPGGRHHPCHRGHPHGEAPVGDNPQGEAHRGHRGVGLGQDHPGAGEPDPRPAGGHRRAQAAGARHRRGSSGHPAGEAHRRHPHRHQRALHRGHLRQYPRRAAEALRPRQRGQSPGLQGGDFSYNTGKLRCPVCDGTGTISLDVQFLPDVEIPCPQCRGSRYSKDAGRALLHTKAGQAYSLPQLMAMDVSQALEACKGHALVRQRLQVLADLGLGYLTLGEATPSLSGGEAQRLKLASEMGRGQSDAVFVFDEPTIGLHPLDVRTLLQVFQTLIAQGATVVVIEHDLDVMRNADYLIDMGPGGGQEGGRVVAAGTLSDIAGCGESATGKFLR